MAVAVHDTCLIMLNTERLYRFLDQIEQDEMLERAQYLIDLPYLQSMSRRQRKKLCANSIYQIYNRNQIVFQEGDLPEHIYIVISGEFEIQSKHKELRRNSPALKILSRQPKQAGVKRVMPYSLIGFEDAWKMRCLSMSFKCVS